jgi:hypothetical protein
MRSHGVREEAPSRRLAGLPAVSSSHGGGDKASTEAGTLTQRTICGDYPASAVLFGQRPSALIMAPREMRGDDG